MGPAIPIAVGAGMGLLNYLGGREQRDWEAAQSAKQMEFQERMSSTAYQRAVADMRMAGLNPALAYMQGSASSPSGAMATTENIVAPATNSARGMARLVEEIQLLEKQAENVEADTQKKRIEGLYEQQKMLMEQAVPGVSKRDYYSGSVGRARLSAQVALAEAQAGAARMSARLMSKQLPGAAVTGSKAGAIARLIFQGLGSTARFF